MENLQLWLLTVLFYGFIVVAVIAFTTDIFALYAKRCVKALAIVAVLTIPVNVNGYVFTVFGNAIGEKGMYSLASLYQKSGGSAVAMFLSGYQEAKSDAVTMIGISGYQRSKESTIMLAGIVGYQKAGRHALNSVGISGYQEGDEALMMLGVSGYQKAGHNATTLMGLSGYQEAERDATTIIGVSGYQKAGRSVLAGIGLAFVQKAGSLTRVFGALASLYAPEHHYPPEHPPEHPTGAIHDPAAKE